MVRIASITQYTSVIADIITSPQIIPAISISLLLIVVACVLRNLCYGTTAQPASNSLDLLVLQAPSKASRCPCDTLARIPCCLLCCYSCYASRLAPLGNSARQRRQIALAPIASVVAVSPLISHPFRHISTSRWHPCPFARNSPIRPLL